MSVGREKCIYILQECSTRLLDAGETRYPRKSDFKNEEVVAIKSYLGPWPRALEAAGIKPMREEGLENKMKNQKSGGKKV